MRATLAYDEAGEIVAFAIPGTDIEHGNIEFPAVPGRKQVDVETDEVEGLNEIVGDVGDTEDPQRHLGSALMEHFHFDAESGAIRRRG
jgi:hypothetical protein